MLRFEEGSRDSLLLKSRQKALFVVKLGSMIVFFGVKKQKEERLESIINDQKKE